MNVTLLSYTPEPERIIATAARLCYSASNARDLKESMSDEKIQTFIKKLVAMGHASPLEHVSFTFGIDGVSRVLTHQLVRHRIASYSQQSQRYVSAHGFQSIVPPSIQENPIALEKFETLLKKIHETYDELVALNIPKEDARYVLANATETKIVVTMNARNLMHFFNVRCCNRAQWEIRELANEMLKQVKQVAPMLFRNAGASCVQTGQCPEGAMTCGKFSEMIKLREMP